MSTKSNLKKESTFSIVLFVFDKYFSLYTVPFMVFVYAVILLNVNGFVGWTGLIAGIWILFAIVAAIVDGLFFFVNRYWLKWRLTWWKNVLISLILFIFTSFLFGLFIRIGN